MRRPEPFTLTLGRPDLSRCEYGLLPRPPGLSIKTLQGRTIAKETCTSSVKKIRL